MHTDEYEISLSRELAVCTSSVNRISRFLEGMSRKYNLDTAQVIEKLNNGELAAGKDFTAWMENHEALKQWEQRKRHYKELLRAMKI
ncbi:MAG: hypothetical protein AABZ10_07665 [Nitrospirota bacterium]